VGFGRCCGASGTIWLCAADPVGIDRLYVAMLLMSGSGIRMNSLFSFLAPSTTSLFLFGASGGMPVFQYGRWWTLLSAGWLHSACCTSSSI